MFPEWPSSPLQRFTWTPSKILPALLKILITLEKEQVFLRSFRFPCFRSFPCRQASDKDRQD